VKGAGNGSSGKSADCQRQLSERPYAADVRSRERPWLIEVHRAVAFGGFALQLALENFLGYRREFLPARGLIVRNVHIGKPRVRRGVLWPPVAFVSELFAANATRTAAFGAWYIEHSTNP
jgi:hypothetical protein